MTDLPDQPTPEAPPRSPRWRSAAWILAALLVTTALTVVAVALFLVAITVMQLQLGGVPESTPSASVVASSEPSAASPVPSGVQRRSIGSGVGASWTVVATFPGATVSDVTAGGPGWVAVGSAGAVGCEICPGIETYTGMIWISTDGRTWDEVAVPGADGGSLYAVASSPGGLVAIGRQALDSIGQQQVLVSADGETWTRVAGTPLEAPGTSVNDVTGGSIFVAVGTAGEPGQNGRPAIWTSTDGRDWVEVYHSPEEGVIHEVTPGGSGWVAVGEIFRPTGGGERAYVPVPVIWISADGVAWVQQDLSFWPGVNGGEAQAVLNATPGLVAVGYAEYALGQPPGLAVGFAAWRSTDGLTWEPAPDTSDFHEDIGGGHLLYEADDRIFAIGSGCRCGTGWPGRWWTAPDGLRWTQHQESPPILYSVIPFDGGLLGVGIEEGEGAIFVSP